MTIKELKSSQGDIHQKVVVDSLTTKLITKYMMSSVTMKIW